MRPKLAIALLLVLSLSCSGLGAELRFDHIGAAEGLSSEWVRCFHQDDLGFIWIGTKDALDRYDGREIKTFRPRVGDERRAINTSINRILRRDASSLWVATNSGVFIFDLASETFRRFEILDVGAYLDLLRDSKGRLWFGSNSGLFSMEEDRPDTLRRHEVDSAGRGRLRNSYIDSLFEDADGRIWVGTKAGLSVWDDESGSFATYRQGEESGQLVSDDILDIAQDREGRMWFATGKGGLEVGVRDEAGEMTFRGLSPGLGIRIAIDRDNLLWLAKGSGGGLLRVDLDRFELGSPLPSERFGYELGNKWSLGDDAVFSVFEDREGDIWIGTFGNGVNYHSKRGKRFGVVKKESDPLVSLSGSTVNCFFEEENYFWVGTMSGLERKDKRTGTFTRYRSVVGDETSLGAEPIFALLKDSRGNFWAGGWNSGLNRFDYDTQTFRRYTPSADPGSLGGSSVFDILEDDRGNLWIASEGGGLNRYVYETDTFERFQHDPEDPDSLHVNYINDILQTRSGDIYLSAYRSLERFDRDTGVFEHFLHRAEVDNGNGGGDLLALYEDSQARIWLATNSGLEYFDPTTERFRLFTKEDGLPSDSVQAMLEDGRGNLWVSTSRGLAFFQGAIKDPDSAVIRSVGESEGLSSSQFNVRAAYRGADGVFYFGSSHGYTHFRPEQIVFNDKPPPIVLTELLLLEVSPDSLSSYRAFDRNVNLVEEVELAHDAASFKVNFAALNYINPLANEYRYKLDGYDHDWIDAGRTASAAYTQLPPGEYTFFVTGSNNDGVWSDSVKSVRFTVLSPWWQTLWFRAMLVAGFVALLALLHRARIGYIQRQRTVLEKRIRERTSALERANARLGDSQQEIAAQNRELQDHRNHLENMIRERTKELEEAKVRAENSDQLKSNFLMNMSHEIRTPMNAIIGFSSLLRAAALGDEERAEFIDIIERNGEALLVLIDDILDISLIQTDQLRLSNETFRVDEILLELRDFYRLKAEKDVTIDLVQEDLIEGLELTADPVRFRQIINNLLSNAYKYTDQGRIEFGCIPSESELLFEVSDTGLGIDEEDQKKIFEHFYKIDKHSARLYPGTGIGLAICRRLVDKMGGRLWVESEPGVGSSFFFTLPRLRSSSKRDREKKPAKSVAPAEGVVLVAEDEDTNYELVALSLRGSGVTLRRAVTGKEAVAYVQENRDTRLLLILMDVNMPVMDGCEACRLIKELRPEVPIHAVTAHALAGDRERILAHGFDGLMTKPIKVDRLVELVSVCSA